MRDGIFKYKIRMPTILRLVDAVTYYHDSRNFGTIKFRLSRQELAEKQSLGPDYLAESTTEQDFVNIVATQSRNETRKFLMDQPNLQAWVTIS
jgi:formamidopyrimidine-DNA glycosylase